jgi:hypothetical protein
MVTVYSFRTPGASPNMTQNYSSEDTLYINCLENLESLIPYVVFAHSTRCNCCFLMFQGGHCQYCVFIYFTGMDWLTILIWTLFVYGNYSVSRKKFTHVIGIHYRIAEDTAAKIFFLVNGYKMDITASVRTNWDLISELNFFIFYCL